MIKAVLIDFDGTLVNSLELFFKAYNKTLQKLNINWSRPLIIDNCFNKKISDVCLKAGLAGKEEKFKDYFIESIKLYFNEVKPFKGAADLLQFLSDKKIKTAIITFSYRWYIDRMLDQMNLKKYFSYVISFEDVKKAKPDPEAIYKACQQFKVKLEEVIMIGDASSDILMGQNAGIKTVLFFPKEHKTIYNFDRLQKHQPDYIINNLLALKDIINNISILEK